MGQADPHGRTVQCPSGYRAYVPAPLPPPIAWDGDLVAALSRADQAIGRLAGEGRRLPNPHLFIRPFLCREAVLSSRIEGTHTTLGELLAAQAGARVEQSSADLREVAKLRRRARVRDTAPKHAAAVAAPHTRTATKS